MHNAAPLVRKSDVFLFCLGGEDVAFGRPVLCSFLSRICRVLVGCRAVPIVGSTVVGSGGSRPYFIRVSEITNSRSKFTSKFTRVNLDVNLPSEISQKNS